MGRLVPAGTGMALYKDIGIQIDAPEELLEPAQEVELGPEEPLDTTAPDELSTSPEGITP